MKKLLLIFGLVSLFSCQKELKYAYELEPVNLSQSKDKSNLKSDLQFVSIAYSDLFGKQIAASDLNVILEGYNSVGDKGVVIDRVLRKMLAVNGIIKPDASVMRADLDAFIEESFERFLVRKPAEMERWFFASIMEKNSALQPEDIYYALMTSTEYRYY
ncbi:MAG: hypothetical protein EP332_11340 [Bacteroidetes bacterium]|nr:MAG: hypothetical protein EP332_11340 [Bacteroidota bacterium]